jgi:hypothetical protein
MAFQTYTITSAAFEAESGDNISAGANPTVTLVISPAAGYTLTHTNFSIGEALPSEVASAVFSQDGDNVNCLVTFDAGFVMPSSDVELLIDIDGTADEQTFTIDGEYTIAQTNVQESATTPVLFSQTAVDETEVTLFTKTFTATSGYYFATPPYYYQTQGAQRNDDAYIITYNDNALGDIITSRSYTVKYLIDGQSKTLNDLNFVANAELIYIPKTGITSYDISLAKIPSDESTRIITAFGEAGDEFIISNTPPYPVDSVISNANNITLTIPAGYTSVSHMLRFPTNTIGSNQIWTFTFSGDLSASFSQTNPLSITQLA